PGGRGRVAGGVHYIVRCALRQTLPDRTENGTPCLLIAVHRGSPSWSHPAWASVTCGRSSEGGSDSSSRQISRKLRGANGRRSRQAVQAPSGGASQDVTVFCFPIVVRMPSDLCATLPTRVTASKTRGRFISVEY